MPDSWPDELLFKIYQTFGLLSVEQTYLSPACLQETLLKNNWSGNSFLLFDKEKVFFLNVTLGEIFAVSLGF